MFSHIIGGLTQPWRKPEEFFLPNIIKMFFVFFFLHPKIICTANSCAAQLKTVTAAQLFIFVPSHVTSTVSSRTPCFLSSHDKARGGKMACENNDFTPCLRVPLVFSAARREKKKIYIKKSERKLLRSPCSLCFLHDGALCRQTLCTHRSVVRANVRGRRHTPLGIFLALCLYNMHWRVRQKWQR